MAVKRYNGSSWDVVAGVGAQGAAATSSTITTWVKTASGGETSLSGNDDNSQSLSYTIGQELVFINGTLLKRGSDYTATNGTSITGLTALAANDVATVWTTNAFSVSNAIANTIVDAKGDILVGTAADTPGILTAGTTGQVLTVDSTTGTGLKWATPAAGGKVLQVVSAAYTTSTTISSTTLTDTGLTASITPASTSNKILVIISQSFYHRHFNSDTAAINLALLRGSTTIADYQNFGFADVFVNGGTTSIRLRGVHSFVYLDSPATTSSTTYKTQGAPWSVASSSDAVFQVNNNPSTITLIEVEV